MKQFTMTKPHSPHLITFSSDPQDSHFVNIEIVKRATGEMKGRHMILKSDLSQWVGMYENDGFEIVERNNESNGR